MQQILAVDDDPHMLKLLERIVLDKTPHCIMTLGNSLEVPQVLAQTTFDLLILDLKMPGLSGLDLLRLVREQKREEEVVIITAHANLESALEAFAGHALDFITKPFRIERILESIDRAMNRQITRRNANLAESLFGLEPYDSAASAFEREYVRWWSAILDTRDQPGSKRSIPRQDAPSPRFKEKV